MLGQDEIERLLDAAGYQPQTPVAVAVGQRSAPPVFVTHGLDSDDLTYAASLAKQVTGACAALLARDGALAPEAPIGAWLPELPGWSSAIRVRHLIHHTAGLPSTDSVWERMEGAGESDWTSDGVIAALATMPELDGDPGGAYAYSSVGYVCLARIIERLCAGTTPCSPIRSGSPSHCTRPAPSTTALSSTTAGAYEPSS